MKVLNGIDVLLTDVPSYLKDARVAYFTNRSGITSDYRPGYLALYEKGVSIKYLFTPEHGLYGAFQAGEKVKESVDPLSGIPIVSTYGQDSFRSLLEDVDVVIFDIQDLGLRFYTYVSSLKILLESVKDEKVLILDRINPLGRKVEGGLIRDEFKSFVGAIDVPLRHGMTVGEVAKFISKNLDIDLEIVKVRGWQGELITEIEDYPFVPPSPAINTRETIFYYMLTVFFEGSNISEGRGTYNPFKIFGAPFFDLRDYVNLDGLFEGQYRFLPLEFIPITSKHSGEVCRGFEIIPIKNFGEFSIFDGIFLFLSVSELYPEDFEFVEYEGRFFIDLLTGTDLVRKNDESFIDKWLKEAEDFREKREEFLLYPAD